MRAIQAVIHRFFQELPELSLNWHRTVSTPGMVSRSSAEISYNILQNSPRVCDFLISSKYFFWSVSARVIQSVQDVIRQFLRRIARVVAWFVAEPHPHQGWFQDFQRKILIIFSISRRPYVCFLIFFFQRERMNYAVNSRYRSAFCIKNCLRCGLFSTEQ